MNPAAWPRDEPLDERLLVVDPTERRLIDARVRDLPSFLRAGDLLVVNDAATLPASMAGTLLSGTRVELRLLAHRGDDRWTAVLFGDGDWRTRTEHRPPPPAVSEGDTIRIASDFSALVERVQALSPRLVDLRFFVRGDTPWAALYRYGRPVQYAHVAAPLDLWHAQTRYASRPWAVEQPSAGRPLTWDLLRAVGARGVGLARLTHAAKLSATGDPSIDMALPLPERYDVPAETVDAVVATKAGGGRVVAVGTTVVRALEGCAADHGGHLVAGTGETDLRIKASTRLTIADGLFTGLHEPQTSHFDLMQAFAQRDLLERAYAHAEAHGYTHHEFGDSSLVLAA
jgi:S-adenosylmethionine:tRNA ribosyltransferase-isomerase